MFVRAKIIGILNITDNSFSDGGLYLEYDKAMNHAKLMMEHGVAIIDVGGESTAWGAVAIGAEEEWSRIGSLLSEIIPLSKKYNVEVSIDTRYPENAIKAARLGIDYINDVSGLESEEIIDILQEFNVKYILVHSLSVPTSVSKMMSDDIDIMLDINKWFCSKLELLESKMIDLDKVVIDPGIGFGKSSLQSWVIVKNVGLLSQYGVKVMLGHSRKSFLSEVAGEQKGSNRDTETLAISSYLINKVDYIRIHDVVGHKKLLDSYNILSEKDSI